MIRIGVIGYGYWGPNIVRNIARFPNAAISWICDSREEVLLDIPRLYPTIKTTKHAEDIFDDPDTQAIIIATPPSTHFSLATSALKAGKHILVEKPMTQTSSEAKKLITLAAKKHLTLMVDHTYLYTSAVQKLFEIIHSGELGKIVAIDCVRTNLGLLQQSTNVIYDLAAHDISILDYLLSSTPLAVNATGIMQKELGQESVAYIAATYPENICVHMHVSWLSPVKVRRIVIIGTKKMVIYDDIESSEKIKIYDKGVSFTKEPKHAYQLRVGYRNGDVVAPTLIIEEGLYGVIREFIDNISNKRPPLTDGDMGLRVVRFLETATKSARSGGIVTKLS